jgi:hypothetical protein
VSFKLYACFDFVLPVDAYAASAKIMKSINQKSGLNEDAVLDVLDDLEEQVSTVNSLVYVDAASHDSHQHNRSSRSEMSMRSSAMDYQAIKSMKLKQKLWRMSWLC